MKIRHNIGAAVAVCLTIFTAVSLAAPRAPRIQTGPDAEISFDGLHRVDRTVMDEAWAKPTLDLTGYSKLLLATGEFAYREVDDVVSHEGDVLQRELAAFDDFGEHRQLGVVAEMDLR